MNPLKNRTVALISAAVLGTGLLAGCGAKEETKKATDKATAVATDGAKKGADAAKKGTEAAKTAGAGATDAAKTAGAGATDAAKKGTDAAKDGAKKGTDAAKDGAKKGTDAAKGAGKTLDPTKASAEDISKALKGAGIEKADDMAKEIKALKGVTAANWGTKLDELLTKHKVTGAKAEAVKKLFKMA